MKDEEEITKDSLWACLFMLVAAGIIVEGSMEEDDLMKRSQRWIK